MPASRDEQKPTLPGNQPEEFWLSISDEYAADDARKWKYVAMLALRELAGWPLERIGYAFGHPKGHVSRCLDRVRKELRDRFDPEPGQSDSRRISHDAQSRRQ